VFHLPGRPDIKFEYIKTFAQKDAQLPLRLAPKLTKDHLETSSQKKMNVLIAYETLSRSVAAGLYAHVAWGQLPQEARQTADFVRDCDELGDSFNGRSVAPVPQADQPPTLKPFKVTLSEGSPHHELWERMKVTMDELTFTRLRSNVKVRTLPFQQSFKMSMNATEQLWGDLQQEGRECLPTKSLNQDYLENFNASVRRAGGNRRNPTSYEFESSFAPALINTLTSPSNKTNCQADHDSLLVDLRSLFPEQNEVRRKSNSQLQLSVRYLKIKYFHVSRVRGGT